MTPSSAGSSVLPRLGIGAAVIAAVVLAGLIWQASTLEDRHDVRGTSDVLARYAWAVPGGYLVDAWDSGTENQELVVLDPDGTVVGRHDPPPGRFSQLSTAGGVLFHDDVDEDTTDLAVGATEITARRIDGGQLVEMWSRGFSVDGADDQLIELEVAAHDDKDRTVVFGCSAADGCWFVGVDSDGQDLWQVDAADLRPAADADRYPQTLGRPWIAPSDLIVHGSSNLASEDGNLPVLAIDIATGTTEEVTTGDRVVTGDGFAAVARRSDGVCTVEIVRDREVAWAAEVPCGNEGRSPFITVRGDTVSHRTGGEEVVVDSVAEDWAVIPLESRFRRTGGGTVLEGGRGVLMLWRIADEVVVHRADSDWFTADVGEDTVVLRRERGSANPLAPDTAEVLVLDARDGSECARARLEGQPARPLIALPGCAALVEIGGRTHLLGP